MLLGVSAGQGAFGRFPAILSPARGPAAYGPQILTGRGSGPVVARRSASNPLPGERR